MKKLLLVLVLLSLNTYAAEGEKQDVDCTASVQASRVAGKDVDVKKEVKEEPAASTSVKQ